MQTSREDVGIAFRSALLSKGSKQRFSLIVLVALSILFILVETIETKPLDYLRSFIRDAIYRGSLIISAPGKTANNFYHKVGEHINLYDSYRELKEENNQLRSNISKSDFLELENTQLRKLIDEQVASPIDLVSARVMLDKKSPYLNSFIINIGSNKNIKNGMAVMAGDNFVGRIVDVNFFSARVLLISDLNSRIPVLLEPTGNHAILYGHGDREPTLEYLPENHNVKDDDKVYTSGKEGIFAPGIPIGKVKADKNSLKVLLFSDLDQITFVNISLKELDNN